MSLNGECQHVYKFYSLLLNLYYYYYYYYYNLFMAPVLWPPGLCPGLLSTRKVKPIWIYWSKRYWVAVASAGPYANMHLAPDNIPPLSFLQAGCPSCHPTNSVEALKAPLMSFKLFTAIPFIVHATIPYSQFWLNNDNLLSSTDPTRKHVW